MKGRGATTRERPPLQSTRRYPLSKFYHLLTLTLCVGSVSPAWADGGRDRLEQFYQQVHTLRADFDQKVFNAQSELVQHASGRVVIQQPGHFRWDYTRPFHQLIVADGKTLWLYDADLDQVTVRPLEELHESTPAVLLSTRSPLEKSFIINDVGEKNGMQWVELRPRGGPGTFKRVRLGFDPSGPREMEVTDSFDQVTQLRFNHLQVNSPVDAGEFHFQPPPGVDVIKE
jgi:outer membrane lipoprotein carrier protein